MISDATLRRVLPESTVRLTGDLIRALLWGFVIVIGLTYLRVYARLWRLAYVDPGSDFTIFYYTARLVADGFPMYGGSPAPYGIHWEADHLGNLNPPHFQLLTHALAFLTYQQAFVAWTTASFVSALATALVTAKHLRETLTWRCAIVVIAFAISSSPFTTVAVTWELTFLLMAPFTLAWLAARQGRWGRAGAWLGLCASLKLFFLIFVPWLVLRRRWRALAAGTATAAGCVLAGSLAYGYRTYFEWLEYLRIVGWEWIHMNASWPGLVARALRGHEGRMAAVWYLPGLERPLSLAGAAIVCAVTVLVAAVCVQVWRRGLALRPGPASEDLAWLLMLLGAILASPLGWVYYLPLALGPFLGVLVSGLWRELPRPALVLIAIAAAGLWVPQEVAASRQPSPAATLTLASVFFYGTAALWLGTIGIVLRHRAMPYLVFRVPTSVSRPPSPVSRPGVVQ